MKKQGIFIIILLLLLSTSSKSHGFSLSSAIMKHRHPTQTATAATAASKKDAALESVHACCRASVVSAVVEGVATTWSLLVLGDGDTTTASAVLDAAQCFGVLQILWKLGFAAGLYHAVQLFQRLEKKDADMTHEQALYSICRIMSRVWRTSAWMIALGSTLDVVAALEGGRRYYGRIIGFATALGLLGLRIFSRRETRVFLNDQDARKMGLWATENMAVCSGALVVRGVTEAVLVLPKPTIFAKVLQASSVQTPLVTAGLLWYLRRAFLGNLVQDDSSTTGAKQGDKQMVVHQELYEAQTNFYSKVAKTFKGEVVAKVVILSVQLVRMYVQGRTS